MSFFKKIYDLCLNYKKTVLAICLFIIFLLIAALFHEDTLIWTVTLVTAVLGVTAFWNTVLGAITGGFVTFQVQTIDLDRRNKRKQERSLRMINMYLGRILDKSTAIIQESLCFKRQYEILEEAFVILEPAIRGHKIDIFFLKVKLADITSKYFDTVSKTDKSSLNKHPLANTIMKERGPFSVFLHAGVLSLNLTSDTINNIQSLKNTEDRGDVTSLVDHLLKVIQNINAIDAVLKEINISMRDISNRWRLPDSEATFGWVELRQARAFSVLLYDDIREIFRHSCLARKRILKLCELYDLNSNEFLLQDEASLLERFDYIEKELEREKEERRKKALDRLPVTRSPI